MTVDDRGRVAVMTDYSGVLTARRDGGLVREVSHEESACKWCEVPHQTRSTHRSTRARQTPQDGDRLQGRLSVSPPSTGGQYEVVRRCRALPRHGVGAEQNHQRHGCAPGPVEVFHTRTMEMLLTRPAIRKLPRGFKFAVIADVHGNDDALKAVLKDIRSHDIGGFFNLGDCLSGPLEPAKTANLLINMDMPTVRGNHDRALLATDRAQMGPSDAFADDQITTRHRVWLARMPPTFVLWDRIFMCHAAPNDDTARWLDTVGPDGRIGLADRAHIERLAQGVPHKLILTAHSHVPRCVELDDGRIIVNPGSVGCPGFTDNGPVPHTMHAGHARASYAIIEEDSKNWDISFRLVSYDNAAAARKASLNRRPDWASALAKGWVVSEGRSS